MPLAWSTAIIVPRPLNPRFVEWRRIFSAHSGFRTPELSRERRGARSSRLPRIGAAREYVADDRWQDRVKEWIDASALIVLLMGKTENLAWEVKAVREAASLHNLVVVFPPLSVPLAAVRAALFTDNSLAAIITSRRPDMESCRQALRVARTNANP